MKTNSRIRTITFWNEAARTKRRNGPHLANALNIDNEGWALLAPFGDSQYPIPMARGGHTTVIQRITKESGADHGGDVEFDAQPHQTVFPWRSDLRWPPGPRAWFRTPLPGQKR